MIINSSLAFFCLARFSSTSCFFLWARNCEYNSDTVNILLHNGEYFHHQAYVNHYLIKSLFPLPQSFESSIALVIDNDTHCLQKLLFSKKTSHSNSASFLYRTPTCSQVQSDATCTDSKSSLNAFFASCK